MAASVAIRDNVPQAKTKCVSSALYTRTFYHVRTMTMKKSLLLLALSQFSESSAGGGNSTLTSNSTMISSDTLPASSCLYTCFIDNTMLATVHRHVQWGQVDNMTSLQLDDWCPFPVTRTGAMVLSTGTYYMAPSPVSGSTATSNSKI